VPIAVIALIGGVLMLKKQARVDNPPTLDIPGTVAVVAGLVSFVYGLANAETDGWSSASTLLLIGIGLALLALFVAIEKRVATPLLPLHIVWDRTRGGSFLVVSIIGIGMFAVFLFLTYYVSLTLGYSPLKTGFAFIPMIVGIIVAASGFSGVVARTGPRIPVFAGLLLSAAGMVLFTQLDLTSAYALDILPGLVITGLGVGLAMAPALSAATSGVDAEHAGVASAMVNTVQQIGGSIGTAVLSAFAATAAANYLDGKVPTQANQALAAMDSYTTVFWWAAGIFAVGAVVCGLLLRPGPIEVDPDAAPVLAH
jgi:Major Facilitator Superfamily